ncbi:ECF transporter S component [Oscillibacter sp.]|uniref:ECF transporter S component n=1 Tax=Oscillibacter sp. TaxID=1945593 RepID=UPI0028A0E291|nr:ECF transporter S component [Oscillibacter sp.]
MENGFGTEHFSAADRRVHSIVTAALLAALACAATMVIRIPSPTGGYLNLGDTVVLLGAFLLGPWAGALAGGIGSAMADALSGYMVYVPATLVIKSVVALTSGFLYRFLRNRTGGMIFAALGGEIPMVAGYWLFDALLLQSWVGAVAGIPGNLVQAGFGVAVSVFLAAALRKSGFVRSRFPNL